MQNAQSGAGSCYAAPALGSCSSVQSRPGHAGAVQDPAPCSAAAVRQWEFDGLGVILGLRVEVGRRPVGRERRTGIFTAGCMVMWPAEDAERRY